MLLVRFWRVLVIWFAGCSLALAVQVGQVREDVIKEKGQPVSVAEGGGRSILTFLDGTVVTFANGRVTQVSARPVSLAPASATKRPATGLKPKLEAVDRRRMFISGGAAVLAAILLARIFFPRPGDFGEAVRYSVQPDWISQLRGEWFKDQWASFKAAVWLTLSFGIGYVVYHVLS